MLVALGKGLLVVEEGRLADEEIDTACEFDSGVAHPGVHDERERLPATGFADFLERHESPAGPELSDSPQVADVGPAYTERFEALGEHTAPVGLLEPPPDRLGSVVEGHREETERRAGVRFRGAGQWMGTHVDGLVGHGRVA